MCVGFSERVGMPKGSYVLGRSKHDWLLKLPIDAFWSGFHFMFSIGSQRKDDEWREVVNRINRGDRYNEERRKAHAVQDLAEIRMGRGRSWVSKSESSSCARGPLRRAGPAFLAKAWMVHFSVDHFESTLGTWTIWTGWTALIRCRRYGWRWAASEAWRL